MLYWTWSGHETRTEGAWSTNRKWIPHRISVNTTPTLIFQWMYHHFWVLKTTWQSISVKLTSWFHHRHCTSSYIYDFTGIFMPGSHKQAVFLAMNIQTEWLYDVSHSVRLGNKYNIVSHSVRLGNKYNIVKSFSQAWKQGFVNLYENHSTIGFCLFILKFSLWIF